jgi:hypothetical protein
MKTEQTEYSETLAFKFQTLGNNPKENIRNSKHGESLKSIIFSFYLTANKGRTRLRNAVFWGFYILIKQ